MGKARKPVLKRRNQLAVELQNPLYKQRVVRNRKGKGSYKRKPKHEVNHGDKS